MSNYNPDENSGHRKPKVSPATIIDRGLAGPKARPKGVVDGQQVNIPALQQDRPSETGARVFFNSSRTFFLIKIILNISVFEEKVRDEEANSNKGGTSWGVTRKANQSRLMIPV